MNRIFYITIYVRDFLLSINVKLLSLLFLSTELRLQSCTENKLVYNVIMKLSFKLHYKFESYSEEKRITFNLLIL